MFPWGKVVTGVDDRDEEQQAAADPVGGDNELLAAVNVYRQGSARGPAAPPAPRQEESSERRRSEHRETERVRRQEMASLFSSLRSLLPLHTSKGKRSMSDHIDLTAKYVKQLEGRIKKLGDIKEHLRTPLPSTINNCRVEVDVFQGGLLHVQILCDEPRLSTSLRVLLQAGLDVLSCVTNRLNQGSLLHTIHCQANGEAWDEIHVHQLQQTLNQLVSSSTNTLST